MNSDCDTYCAEKENVWRKNELAHQRMRTKSTGRAFCTGCRHRMCGDPTRVHGARSLKKLKVVVCNTTKVDRRADVCVGFLNARNGETFDNGMLDAMDVYF